MFSLKSERVGTIEVIKTVKEMQRHSDQIRSLGKRIALVPTMGFLHEGHLSLMLEGRKRGDCLVASIFVNPTQFGPGEDFDSYPRALERDLSLLQKAGADAVFTPDRKSLYSENFQTYVTLEHLPEHLCGISRPTFFRGVATVVAKLFTIVKPHVAVFGQKDYQQLLVIRRMVRDLNFDIDIVGAPTVRESDGLAMSSRNSYLTPQERTRALCLFNAMKKAQALLKSGLTDASKVMASASALIESQPQTEIDYIAICDPETLEDVNTIQGPVLMALAVKVGKTRLIDNMILEP